jgi:serine/threonine protein kinase
MLDKIKDYKILKEIATGGMGVVYKAVHPGLKNNVIIKELSIRGKEMGERFEREAKILMTLRQDNIVSVYDYFIENGKKYIVMEYVDGVTLADVITKKKKLKPLAAILVFNEIARGLDYAHSKSVIHRDLKPRNILISKSGEVKIIDFGIAAYDQTPGDESTRKEVTREGVVIGTPAYMSPEQLTNAKETTTASDVYSMGIILFEMVTGETPFGRSLTPESIAARMKKNTRGSMDSNIPSAIKSVITKSLRYDPRRRYKSISVPYKRLERNVKKLTPSDARENIRHYVYSGKFAPSMSCARPVYSSFIGSFKESRKRRYALIISACTVVIAAASFVLLATPVYYYMFMRNRVGRTDIRFVIPIPWSIIPYPRLRLPDKKLYLARYEKTVTAVKNKLYRYIDDNYKNMIYNFQIRAVLTRQELRRGIVRDIVSEETILRPENYIRLTANGFTVDFGDSRELRPFIIFTSPVLYRAAGRYMLKINLNNQSYWSTFDLPSLTESNGPLVVETMYRETPQRSVTFNFDFTDEATGKRIDDVDIYIFGGTPWYWISWEKSYAHSRKNREQLLNGRRYDFLFRRPDYISNQVKLFVCRDQNVVNVSVRLRPKEKAGK